MSAPPPTPRKRRKEARPSELTAAALDLFAAKGFSATRLEEVAQLAGVSKGTLYLYFASKEDLFKAVIREGVVPVVEAGEALAAQHTGSAFDLITGILLGWWTRIGTTRLAGIPRLMAAEARNFPEVAAYYYENVIRRGRKVLADALRAGMVSGEFRQMDVEPTIDVVIGPMLTLLVWHQAMAHCMHPRPDPEAILRTHLDVLKQGLVRR